MADTGAPLNSSIKEEHLSSAAATDKDDLEILRGVVRSLPPQPLKELLSNGICARCILKQFSLSEEVLSRPTLATPILSAILRELAECDEDGAISCGKEAKDSTDVGCVQECQEEFEVCRVCLGILQFVYSDDKGMSMEKNHASDFAVVIGDAVKQEGHQIDSFCLEVSLPSTVVENEQSVWKYINKKYSSESWFKEKFPSESMGVKDFLKLSVTKSLEKLMDVKSSESTFRVRLTYTLSDASSKNQTIHESNGCSKRRKTDDNDVFKNSAGSHNAHERNSSFEQQHDGNGFVTFPLEKYSRNVSQTRWIIDDERMGEASIEEIVGSNILPVCKGDNYKFHAAGREDIDVRMLGTGRPFLVEIQNARLFPSDTLIRNMEVKINTLESKFVRVKNLKFLGSQGWDLMREGEAEKQKQYAALVWISRPLDNDDVQTLSSLKDLQIVQKTPIRVLHRRSPLGREKTIHWMRVERIAGSSQYFLLHLCTQAGTYIKEFVHGDLGRTHPSVGSILGCRSEILRLDVTDVKMDCFQE